MTRRMSTVQSRMARWRDRRSVTRRDRLGRHATDAGSGGAVRTCRRGPCSRSCGPSPPRRSTVRSDSRTPQGNPCGVRCVLGSVRVTGRVRAPELRGAGGWLNTGRRELTLAGLRGRIVLLDFWTSACANCLHVIEELRPLEARYADVLTTIGVHSPKFPHEAEHAAVEAAVRRYDVRHPVLDDPDLSTWRQYAVN